MTLSSATESLCYFQDSFYRCKYRQLLRELEEQFGESLTPAYSLIKANALFELHQVKEARKVLKSVKRTKENLDEDYLYALARMSYLDGDAVQAREIFQKILDFTTCERHEFKSLLGIANTYYSRKEWIKIPDIISQLAAFEPLERDDERISLMIFLGNYYYSSKVNCDLARHYFKKALSTAAVKTWTYFITRSLYGLAGVCEDQGQQAERLWTLEILQSFVDESEQLFFSHVVNNRFKNHFSINTPMEFDTSNKRIMIKQKWVPFHDKPMLFQFLLMLHTIGDFVNKKDIARNLWPDQEYKPRIHDPRIFDIAKRARNIIEAYENQPVVLLSGRMGYKLAST